MKGVGDMAKAKQGRTALMADILADVAFEEVWEAGFGLAERSGDPEDNLVAWICSCCPEEPEDPDEENE